MRPYAALMSPRTLLALLLAVAVLFAPMMTRSGQAMAAMPDHSSMAGSDSCKMPKSGSADHGKMDKNCCMAMCTAVAVAPSAPAEASEPAHGQAYFAAPRSWHGFLGEIATPPPRTA